MLITAASNFNKSNSQQELASQFIQQNSASDSICNSETSQSPDECNAPSVNRMLNANDRPSIPVSPTEMAALYKVFSVNRL